MPKLPILAVLAPIFLSLSSGAAAGVRDQAEYGTYLSNVCWLIEEFNEGNCPGCADKKVLSANEEKCTVKLEHRPEGKTRRTQVYFNRVILNDITVRKASYGRNYFELRGKRVARWEEDVVVGASVRVGSSDSFSNIGTKSPYRVLNALSNLYTKYCLGVWAKESEF